MLKSDDVQKITFTQLLQTIAAGVRGIWSVSLTRANADTLRTMIGKNRVVRRSQVAFIVQQIDNGEWQADHPSPLVFATTGDCIDGQHRILAFFDALENGATTITTRVETGARPEIREYIDINIPRSLHDRVEFSDDPVLNVLVSRMATSYGDVKEQRKSRKVTTEEAKRFYAQHREALEWLRGIHCRSRGVGQMAVAVAAMEYFEINRTFAQEFYSDLFRAAGDIHQAQLLRDWLIRTSPTNTGYRVSRRELYGKAIWCMEAHLNSRDIKRVMRAQGWSAT